MGEGKRGEMGRFMLRAWEKGIAFRALWGRERKRGEQSKKYLKKYFGEAEKIPTFAAPQVGKEKEPGGARPRGMR